jgi:long-chain fatty acid transport protein
MGNAYAGGGAVAEDASTVWFNPASISRLDSQMQASGHVILPTFDYTDDGAIQVLTSGAAGPLLPGAPTTASGDKNAVVPNLYYIRRFNDRLTFGLAVNAPFGLVTKYQGEWKGRYQTIKSEIINLNVNPALSFKANKQLSFGAGISLNYIDAEFTQAVDTTAACLSGAAPLGPAALATCVGFDPTNPTLGAGQGTNDGSVKQDGDDLSFGFNLGMFYEWSENTRFSLAYRSQINHKLDGDAQFTLPGTISSANPLIEGGVRARLANSGLEVGASLPDSFSLSAYHRFHPKFALMGDATWTSWSDIPELRFVYDNPATLGGSAAEELRWDDAWRLGLGAHYYHNDRLTLRTGIAYDQAPVSDPTLRTPRLPDNDRLWVSFGASYRFRDKLSADFGYSHLFISDTNIARVGSSGSVLNGSYDSDVNILSVQVNYEFD